jgi:G:T-mismatch repair DNA endonuclease (very short patch repair protein)
MILYELYDIFVIFINMNKITWSKEEIDNLINKYPNSCDDELIEMYPNRTLVSIKVKAKKLKLKKTKEAEFINRSKAHTGNNNGMFGKTNKLKGKKYSDVYGVEKSDEIKSKLSEYRKNNPIDVKGEKNPMFGKIPKNKGTKQTDEVKKNLSLKAIERYKNLSTEEKEKRKNLWIEKVLIPLLNNKKKTKPELVFEKLLDSLNIEFNDEVPIGFYIVDYLINDIIFEIQGDYWHANPKYYDINLINKTQTNNVNRDKSKKTYLTNRGYKVFYIWEDEFKNEELVKNKIKEILNGTA